MNSLAYTALRSASPRYPAWRQAGMSLIELMISMTVGLLLLAGITALISNQSSTSAELDKSSRQIENGRYATQLLKDDIELASFYGEYYDLPNAPTGFPNPCSTAIADLEEAMPLHIQGYDSPATVPAALAGCLANTDHAAGTDILVVRRADTATVATAAAVAGQIYLQAGLNISKAFDRKLGTGSDTSVFTLQKKDGSTAPLRKFLTHIYYVSPCNIPASGTSCTGSGDDNGRPIPTLKLLELTVDGGTPVFRIVPLVEGIDNLQFDYGLDNDGDGAPDGYTTGTYSSGTTAMTPADWANVMTVRANILARNNEPTGGHVDSKTYQLGETAIAAYEDGYKRRVFSATIRAINASGRRAK